MITLTAKQQARGARERKGSWRQRKREIVTRETNRVSNKEKGEKNK